MMMGVAGDKDCEKALLKSENKSPSVYNNAITQQPNRQAQQVRGRCPPVSLRPPHTVKLKEL